jgi:hypothetical protein
MHRKPPCPRGRIRGRIAFGFAVAVASALSVETPLRGLKVLDHFAGDQVSVPPFFNDCFPIITCRSAA